MTYLIIPKYMRGTSGPNCDPYDYPTEATLFGDWKREFKKSSYNNISKAGRPSHMNTNSLFAVATVDGHGYASGYDVAHIYRPAPKEFVTTPPVWFHVTSRDVAGDDRIVNTGMFEGDRLGWMCSMGMPDDPARIEYGVVTQGQGVGKDSDEYC